MGQLCIYCEHWTIEFEGPFSSQTPGSGFESQCLKGRWYMDGKKLGPSRYRANLEKGLTCPDFQKAKDLARVPGENLKEKNDQVE